MHAISYVAWNFGFLNFIFLRLLLIQIN